MRLYETDKELKKMAGKQYKYFVSYANDTKMKLFKNKKEAKRFMR